jgi:hypothetical protein
MLVSAFEVSHFLAHCRLKGSKENAMYVPSPGFHRAAAITLLVAGGCGDLANQDTEAPALATPSGSVNVASSATVPEGELRLALIWHVPQSEDPSTDCFEAERGRGFPAALMEGRFFLGKVQQSVELTPGFPSAFKLELSAPPPPEAIYEEEDGLHRAEGTLVVYRDGNDNGKLDPRTDAGPSPDQVLSNDLQHQYGLSSEDRNLSMRTWGYAVVYLDQPRKYSDMLDLQSGFNVLEYQNYGARVATEISLELLPTAELQTQLCTNTCLSVTSVECPTNPADLPAAPVGAVAGFAQSGKAWVWENGDGGFGFQAQYCIRTAEGYLYTYDRTVASDCSERETTLCSYGPEPQPSPDWPCSVYLDLQTRTYVSP